MAGYEEKFIVINMKRFEELNDEYPGDTYFGFADNKAVTNLLIALEEFRKTYEANIGPLDQKYYICNQDEPYAQKIIDMLLDGETQKEKKG